MKSNRLATVARRLIAALQLSMLLVAFALLVAGPVGADDCGRDPNNLRDCLRTNTAAQNIAGTTAVIVVIVVNGVEVGRVLFPPKDEEAPVDGGETEGGTEPEKKPRQFYLQIESRDEQSIKTALDADMEDQLTVYARCLEVGKELTLAADATESIDFSLSPTSVWVEMSEAPPAGGAKAVSLRTTKPDLRGMPPASVTVSVSATIEGNTVSGSVTITLTKRKLRVEVLDTLATNPLPMVHERAERVGLRFNLLDRGGQTEPAPKGGLSFQITFHDASRSPAIESEADLAFDEGQSSQDYEYVEFSGEEARNGGGVVTLRASDADGRPVGLESPPDYRMKNEARFFIIAPLSITGVRVAIERVGGLQATDRVEKTDNFVVEMKDLDDVVADTEG